MNFKCIGSSMAKNYKVFVILFSSILACPHPVQPKEYWLELENQSQENKLSNCKKFMYISTKSVRSHCAVSIIHFLLLFG